MEEQKIEVQKTLPDDQGNITINHMKVMIRTVDRSRKDISDWWDSLQEAERNFYANRTNLYDLYSTVRLDGHLTGIIEKRMASVLNKSLYFSKDGKKIDELNEVINGKQFRSMLRELFEQKMWGLTGLEFIPGETFDFNVIPRKHIKPEIAKITTEQWGQEGFDYRNVWNIWVIGDKDDLGILLKCCPYAIWKKGNMGDWAQYIEVFGQPMIIFTYDAHDIKTKNELDQLMNNIGSGTKLQVPKQVELKIEDGKQNNGNGDLQDKFRTACNDEMSVIILGVTETTTSSGSSGYAQSKTHGQQQQEIIKGDMMDLLNYLNDPKFISILKSYGYPVDGGQFCFEQEQDINQMKVMLDMDIALSKLVPLADDYFYETYGRPKPDNYDELKTKMEEQSQAALNQIPNDAPADPNDNKNNPKKKKKVKRNNTPEDQAAKSSRLEKFMLKLADFFDPAHNS